VLHEGNVFHLFAADWVDYCIRVNVVGTNFLPKAIDMLADYMFQKLSCDHFLGERFCECVGTLRGAARPVSGVTTLGSNGMVVVSPVLIVFCDLVWYYYCMGEVRIGYSITDGLLSLAALAGSSESSVALTFWNLFLKISASFVSAAIVSSPTCANGTSGWGFFNALNVSLAAMINLYVEDNCGIGELWGKKL
jgi:hypothetical protein